MTVLVNAGADTTTGRGQMLTSSLQPGGHNLMYFAVSFTRSWASRRSIDGWGGEEILINTVIGSDRVEQKTELCSSTCGLSHMLGVVIVPRDMGLAVPWWML